MAQSTKAPAQSPADPTSVVVVDEESKEASHADFFSFNSPGGFTWWAGAILGVLGCCAFASMIVIHVKSNARAPPAVMALMSTQQCPFLSSLLPPLAFDAWRTTCSAVRRGVPYPCTTPSDCTALGVRCADPKLLAQLQCASASVGAAATAAMPKVCVYPSLNSTASSVVPLSSGFCTAAGTTCALCLDGRCGSTSTSAGSIGCPSSAACSSTSWLCNPLRA